MIGQIYRFYERNTSLEFQGRNKWISKFQINNKVYNLGYFDLEIEAAKIYNQKAKELLGDKAKLNIL